MIIFGASGDVGHVAIQLAKLMGTEVLAVASDKDGVQLVKRLGADASIDGRTEDVDEAVKRFAPEGLDAAMAFAGGPNLDKALEWVKDGERITYRTGLSRSPESGQVSR